MRKRVLGIVVLICSLGSGCEDVNDMFTTNSMARVEMQMIVSGVNRSFAGPVQVGVVDSIRIDSAIVVLSRIKFENHLDELDDTSQPGLFSDPADDMDDDDETQEEDRADANVWFKGPIVVVVRDTTSIDLGSASLAPGFYSTVKMKVHRLMPWGHHWTIDREGRHDDGPKRYLGSTGSSVMAWGSLSKDGIWQPFAFAFDGEFKVARKVDLTITAATQVIPLALHVDAREWFVHPRTGELLDPYDISPGHKGAFTLAIQRSFYEGELHECDDEKFAFNR